MPRPARDHRSSDWLAGFADGEATFLITRSGSQTAGRRRAFSPRFAITLRADDVGVLRELSDVFGGSIHVGRKRPDAHPCATWTVASKCDLARIIEYFDAHPLGSKKGRDFAIWREAALLYIECENSADIVEQMEPLRDTLNGGRLFVAGADEPAIAEAAMR